LARTSHKEFLLESAVVYEQVLETMPNDKFSIQALIDIYKEVGDVEKQSHYEKLLCGDGTDAQAKTNSKSTVRQVQITVNNTKANRQVSLQSRPSVSDPVPTNWRRKGQELDQIKLTKALADLVFKMQYALKSQVDLLISLYDVGVLNGRQLSSIMYKLSEHKFARDPQKPEMVMHMLEACPGIDLNKVYYFLSRKTNLPYIDLSVMPYNSKLYDLFPTSLVYNQGIVVFKKIVSDYCIAVLNPLNIELMQQTGLLLNENVHFFLTSAREFDLFLKKGRGKSFGSGRFSPGSLD
jgi:hypothetical protein